MRCALCGLDRCERTAQLLSCRLPRDPRVPSCHFSQLPNYWRYAKAALTIRTRRMKEVSLRRKRYESTCSLQRCHEGEMRLIEQYHAIKATFVLRSRNHRPCMGYMEEVSTKHNYHTGERSLFGDTHVFIVVRLRYHCTRNQAIQPEVV